MPKVAVYNAKGETVGEIELKDEIFGIEPNRAVLHDMVICQMASWRRGTADTKRRGEVQGSTKKPWRQKGTGRARSGSKRSPVWRKGGVAFGPHPRSYAYTLPRKVRRLALKSALSSKVQTGDIIVLDQLVLSQPKTKDMIGVLAALNIDRKALVVTAGIDPQEINVEKSARNIPGVKPIVAGGINVYDLLNHDKLVITREAVARVEEVLA
ncbi:MAG: 50S ribosomal protein L4 [Firmicutes bacterium]|nr:50S ribosomal protein L4 [Bacillota bacterium]